MKRLFITSFMMLLALPFTFGQIAVQYGTIGRGGNAAQKPPKIIDTAVIQVTYQVRSIIDSLAPDRVTEDKMVLQIGKNRISKFFADTRVRDSIMQATIERARASGAESVTLRQQNMQMQGGPMGSGDQSIVFKNYPSGSVTVTDRVMMDIYSYSESTNGIVWEILPDTDTIMYYTCQKAITTFRGRKYEAWFTPDIPVNDGPWKFCGLPGLILKVFDHRQHYLFECTSIEQITMQIEFADFDYLKTNRRDLARIKRKFYEDPVAAMESMRASVPAGANVRVVTRNADGTATSDMNEIRNNLRNRAYNPIELDL